MILGLLSEFQPAFWQYVTHRVYLSIGEPRPRTDNLLGSLIQVGTPPREGGVADDVSLALRRQIQIHFHFVVARTVGKCEAVAAEVLLASLDVLADKQHFFFRKECL